MFATASTTLLRQAGRRVALSSFPPGISTGTSRTVVWYRCTLRLSSGGARVVAPKTASQTTSRFHRLVTIFKYVRIPLLVISVYGLGYQQGIIDCTKEPKQLEKQLLSGILIKSGCKSPDDVQFLNSKDIVWHSSSKNHRVAAIGDKIVSTARALCHEKLEAAQVEARQASSNQIDTNDPQQLQQLYDSHPKVAFWKDALVRLEGEDAYHTVQNIAQPSTWQYILVNSPSPNAFVTEILPKRLFITSSMLDLATTADELAVVIGHEVSHLLLGHVSDTNKVETALRTIEILLLSMDPTAGALSALVMMVIYAMRQAVSASLSREKELEADSLGLELAAAACFDTRAGSKVMKKMHEATTKTNTGATQTGVFSFLDSHPPTLERYQQMRDNAKEENYYKHGKCLTLSKRFLTAVWRSSDKENDDE